MLLNAAVLVSALATTTPANAADEATNACLTASEDAQALRDKGRLLDARAKLIACGRGACPAVVRTDCAKWLDELTPRIPAIVVRARDAAGRDVVDAKTFVDGTERATSADGRAIDVDPGVHKVRLERPGNSPLEQTVVAREGERTRAVDFVFPDAAPPAQENGANKKRDEPRSEEPRVPVISWILGGVAVAGGVSFGYFASAAKSDVDDMRARCAPGCPESDVSSARTELTVANVSLAAAVLALGAALVFVRW